MYAITGKLIVKNEAEQVTDKFRKREFVITDDSSGMYPQFILFQLVQDKCELLDPFEVGEEVKVNFNLRGRKWENPKTNETRYFNSIEAWRLEKVGVGTANSDQAPFPENAPVDITNDDSDDLPF